MATTNITLLPCIDNSALVNMCATWKNTRLFNYEHSPTNLKVVGITQRTTRSGLCEYCHMKHVIKGIKTGEDRL